MSNDLVLDPPLELRDHHREALTALRDRFLADPTVLALLLGGSLAHGFAGEFADIDFVAVVTPEERERRAAVGELTYAAREPCTYPGGYVDGKFVDVGFLRAVAERGSEPARFAFADARVVFDHGADVRPLLDEIVRYPDADADAGADDRMHRFAAQLLAWQWYFGQGIDKDNRYLQVLAVQKLVLFSCRLVLAENRLLYPYHKWMLRVTADAPRRPPSLIADLDRLLTAPTADLIDAHVRGLLAWVGIDHSSLAVGWGGRFLADNELTWLTGDPVIDDV